MEKFNYRSINDISVIPGFGRFESAILQENGINTKEEFEALCPDLTGKHEKKIRDFLWNHCELKYVDKFKKILEEFKSKKVCILSDYDADGILGATIMRMTLEKLGYDCFHIIPDRLLDGFAVKNQHIDRAIAGGAELIITVDNGTSAADPVRYAKEKGLTVIITDHHLAEGEIPAADLLINPHLNGDSFEDICGAVVALKIATYLLRESKFEQNWFYEILLDLGTIATVGDMMPVIGENRVLIKLGLESINKVKDDGVYNLIGKILCGMADTDYMSVFNYDKQITEETLAYYVCSVLNATGRVDGDVNKVVADLLACHNNPDFFLRGYKQKNKERKFKTREISEWHQASDCSVDVTVLNEADFNYQINGLVGLLANKISNSEHKPCFVGYIPLSNNICKFSGRTVNGYSIYDAFLRIKEAHPELEMEGGGHEGAIGIEMPIPSIETFQQLMCEDYNNYDGSEAIPNVYYLDPDDVDEACDAHYKMQPFGERFKKLKFLTTGKITQKNEAVNMIVINGLEFKVYTKLSNLPPVGATVNAYFSISFGNKQYSEFKIEEIEVV